MLNHAQVIGHVGRDPESMRMPNGIPIASFSVATTEKWKDKESGEKKESTEWHRVVVIGRVAEIVEKWVKKGSLVYVSGKLQTRKYKGKDGTEKQSTEIKADNIRLLNGLGNARTDDDQPTAKTKNNSQQHIDDLEDDIPF